MPARLRGSIGLVIVVALAGLILVDRLGLLAPRTTDDSRRYDEKVFTVVRVVDGDTLDLDVPDLIGDKPFTRVRLWGIDTPETRHPKHGQMYFGAEAATGAEQLVLGKTVTVRLEPFKHSRDKYDRLLAYIFLQDGRMLNEELLSAGLAYADERFGHICSYRFEQLQEDARRRKCGLWQNVRPDQWPDWRRRRHDPDYVPASN